MSGTVYLVGAGPGAPDLLTVRAVRILERADIVFHDALVHTETLALAARARHIAVGKRCGRHSTAQRFINKRLVDAAQSHAIVVRLKGGDPMLFGRAQEEIDALRAAGITVVVVPGVTSALAASAELGASLTQRGVSRSVAFVTPRVGENERASSWVDAAVAADTAVIYMGRGEAAAITDALIAHGRAPHTPVAIVESASHPDSTRHIGRLVDLPALAALTGDGPTMIILGEVVRAAMRSRSEQEATRLKRAGSARSLNISSIIPLYPLCPPRPPW
ncbi:MAG: uroporphyrinogen-III C-methyltransferase [Burkholderiales bacterium]